MSPPPPSLDTGPTRGPNGPGPGDEPRAHPDPVPGGSADAELPGPDAGARAEDLTALADWMTEEVAQQLYAARQDLADIAHEDDSKRADVDEVNAQLLDVIHSLHEIAGVLRSGAIDARLRSDGEGLAAEVRTSSATAHELIVRCLALVDRGLGLRAPRSPDADRRGTPER